jgi:hypothetical protein
MKRSLAVLAFALACVLMRPAPASAQCNERCVKFSSPLGSGYGCIVDNDSGAACIARSTVCYTKLCWNAMVTDPSGRTLAVADICGDNVTVRSLASTSKPRSAEKLRAQRGTGTVAAAGKAREPTAG